MLDKNGVICEYNGYTIDPAKINPSGKTIEELEAEAEELRKQIYKRHSEQDQK